MKDIFRSKSRNKTKEELEVHLENDCQMEAGWLLAALTQVGSTTEIISQNMLHGYQRFVFFSRTSLSQHNSSKQELLYKNQK